MILISGFNVDLIFNILGNNFNLQYEKWIWLKNAEKGVRKILRYGDQIDWTQQQQASP